MLFPFSTFVFINLMNCEEKKFNKIQSNSSGELSSENKQTVEEAKG